MSKNNRIPAPPFVVIAYNQQKLFFVESVESVESVEGDKSEYILPIFTEIHTADRYRRFFAMKFKIGLIASIVHKPDDIYDLIECATIMCPKMKSIVINPELPVHTKNTKPCIISIEAMLKSLRRRCRKVHNRRHLRKNKD